MPEKDSVRMHFNTAVSGIKNHGAKIFLDPRSPYLVDTGFEAYQTDVSVACVWASVVRSTALIA
jgi:hypothetical protein